MTTDQHQHSVEFWLAKCKPTSKLSDNITVDHDLFSYLGLRNFSSSVEKQYSDAKKIFKGQIASKDTSSCSFTAPAASVAAASLEYGPQELCVAIMTMLNSARDEVVKLVPPPYDVADAQGNAPHHRTYGAVGVVKHEESEGLHPTIAKFIAILETTGK